MCKAVILFLLPFSQLSCVLGGGAYECGDHGRFEYCIDEIPGCVTGCHCHPGYYFDTDTKICEPNSRLIEHHMRRNMGEPTRVQKIDVTPNAIYDTEPASTTNMIDVHVDEITKNANDLGDWLYNQFFKTIENQVINSTNDVRTLSRRSGSQQPIQKLKKKKKNGHKGQKSSKQKGKNEHLRRKLLRITENDSLFDLSSKSSSDSSDSSSSDSSAEYKTNEYQHKHDDDEHGHKKIVMINKKPKQQLPNFIFLPNLDTPFYPPIGLPPPPIIPMYPIVPVPPVSLCPFPGGDVKVDSNTVTSVDPAVTAASTATATTNLPQTSTVILTTDGINDVPNPDIKSLRLKNKQKKKAEKFLDNDKSYAEQGINSIRAIDRQKALQHLKTRMSHPSAKLRMPSWNKNTKVFTNTFSNQNTDAETEFLNNEFSNDVYVNNEIQSKAMQEDSPFPDNVDFKYITELIHRVDINNKSNVLPPIDYNTLSSGIYQPSSINKKQFTDYSVPYDPADGRRLYRPIHHQSDQSYYTNLGRQIATMIRGIDTQNRQAIVNLEETPSKEKKDPYFNNNSPTSFWERSVRSPIALLKNKKIEYLKRSNELLFDIENKVEIIASTVPSLSLQEIENIVNVMEAAKTKIQTKYKQMRNLESSNNSLNVDLWPQKSHISRNSFQHSMIPPINADKQVKRININYKTNNNNFFKPINNLTSIRMHSIQNVVSWNGVNENGNIKLINETSKIQTAFKPTNKNSYFETVVPHDSYFGYPNAIQGIPARTNPLSQHIIRQSFLNQQINPVFLHHRKYFQDNNNYYVNENRELPPLPTAARVAGIQPSYFRHNINHLDYIE